MDAPAQPAAADPVLKFDDVSLSFGHATGLDHVSFALMPGETRVILGAAGTGKTTLLKVAIGLLKADSGRVYLLGRDITSMDERELFGIRRKVGVLFQEGGLFDSLTVADNVRYPLVNPHRRGIDMNEVNTKVEQALQFVELGKTLEKFPAELSGGMRRRVGIARAVVTEPPLVLYDSPTAGLDPITANTIMALIAKERDTANTANLIVTYRYQDGELMANFRFNPDHGRLERIGQNGATGGAHATTFMVMNEGKVVFEGDQRQLEESKDSYVVKFVPKRQ